MYLLITYVVKIIGDRRCYSIQEQYLKWTAAQYKTINKRHLAHKNRIFFRVFHSCPRLFLVIVFGNSPRLFLVRVSKGQYESDYTAEHVEEKLSANIVCYM
jgi:hypothetical protein